MKNNNILIYIEDNGIGIKDIESIGNKFYTTKANGNGLGIIFSKTIVLLHKGDIKYSSFNKRGTKVIISLPLVNL